jgi:signal transduction histidine kinase/ActR/RegA family two-component response regulator
MSHLYPSREATQLFQHESSNGTRIEGGGGTMNHEQTTKILIVDDEPVVSKLLSLWLTAEGYFCDVASNGEAAVELLKRGGHHLVVSDIMMPGMSGLDLLTIIRNLFPDAAVLMVTAVDDRETAIMTLELGAFGYVIKPFDRNEILINVANALERRRLTLISRDHERALEAKVQLNEKYRKLVQFFPYGIAEFALSRSISSGMTDEELLALILEARVTDGNIEFARSYGYDKVDSVQGAELREVFSLNGRAEEFCRAWIQNGFSSSTLETRENGAIGGWRYFENTLLGHVQNGHLSSLWGIRRDITERKRIQETLLEKIRIIDELYEHMFQSCRSKTIEEHTARVAHELRQPLAIIGGFARRMVKQSSLPESSESISEGECLPIMIKEIGRLEKILDGLIDFTSHESVQLKLVNPNELIQYVLDINEPGMKEKGIILETVFGEEIGEIPLDAVRFQEVVRNLLSEAVTASPGGGVIRLETDIFVPSDLALKTGGLESESYFEMKIHNSGSQVPTEDLERIFDPFVRTTDYGTGIGLVLAKKIIEEHHGSISVKSNEQGTLFTVWLPLRYTPT